VNEEFTASIVISRSLETARGSLRWTIRLDAGLLPDVTVAVRMDRENRAPLDYFLLPRIDTVGTLLRLGEENGMRLDAYRADSLDSFVQLAARVRLAEVA
jgi:hypothetical protein